MAFDPAAGRMAHDVFISYSSKDKPAADAVCAALENARLRCWIAPRDIAPGADWSASIMEAISGGRVLLLIFSGHANTSRHVQREVQHACDQGLAVVPFRLENVLPTGGMKYYLGTVHWLDALTPPMERYHAMLVSAVQALMPIMAEPDTAEGAVPVDRALEPEALHAGPAGGEATPGRRRWRGWALAGAMVLAGVALWVWPRDKAAPTVPAPASTLHPASTVSPAQTDALVAQAVRKKLDDARALYDAGDYVAAQVAYREAAGLDADSAEAREYLEQIRRHAASEAQAGYNRLHQDEPEALRHFQTAAALGDADGENGLAKMYEKGRGGLPVDVVKAVELYKLSAAQGNAQGRASLGFMYESGQGGLPHDNVKAVNLYKLAVAQGNADAQAGLGWIYARGLGGLAIDVPKAVELCKLSVAQGNAYGQVNLGFLYESGREGLSANEIKAVELYKLAAAQGNDTGQACLGRMYETGRGGLPVDTAKAVELYQLSVAQGNAYGQAYLGWMYETGRGGLPVDEAKATELCKLSAAKQNHWGQAYLGAMYENGRGVPKDRATAIDLYRKAAGAGIPFAKDRLRALGESFP